MCSSPILTDRYMIQDCSNGYSYGSNCSLSCTNGFPLIGNDTITCEKTENDSIKITYWDVGSYNPYCKSKLYSDCSTEDKCSHYITSFSLANFHYFFQQIHVTQCYPQQMEQLPVTDGQRVRHALCNARTVLISHTEPKTVMEQNLREHSYAL